MINLTWDDVRQRAEAAAEGIMYDRRLHHLHAPPKIFPIPNGGIPAALEVARHCNGVVVEEAEEADVFVDDLVDSGATAARWSGKPFYSLMNKQLEGITDWVSFPWERMGKQDGPQDNVRRILQYIGEDPKRPGLLETPDRVVKSYTELFSGYKADEASVFKTFDEPCDEMVVIRDVEFCSTCEHHMLPFIGRAHIAYVPDRKVIGASKLPRLLEVYARRLQIQERIGQQVTAAMDKHLRPKGSACILEAKHLCMTCRGVNKQHSVMNTASLTGVFRGDAAARQELYQLIRGNNGR